MKIRNLTCTLWNYRPFFSPTFDIALSFTFYQFQFPIFEYRIVVPLNVLYATRVYIMEYLKYYEKITFINFINITEKLYVLHTFTNFHIYHL